MHFKKSTLSFHYTFKIVILWHEWKQGGERNSTHAIYITWPKMFLDIFKLSLYWIYVEENSPNLPNLRDVKIDFWFCVVWEWNKYRRPAHHQRCPNMAMACVSQHCVCVHFLVRLTLLLVALSPYLIIPFVDMFVQWLVSPIFAIP